MKGNGRLRLVQCAGDGPLAADAAVAGFTVLLEIWHSAMEELVRGITPDQLRTLLIIDGAGKVTPKRLADALGVDPPAISRLCAEMEEAGWLRRRQAGPGSGVILILLTATGRGLVTRIREQRHAVLDHVLQSLTPAGRESLARGLRELAASPP
jgi:DNA-binding MarR family transcriptional regulator